MLIFDSKKFRKDRLDHGYTYGTFAKALQKYVPKAAKSIIHNWEKGSVPSLTYLVAIGKIFGRDPQEYMRPATEKEARAIEEADRKRKAQGKKKKKGPKPGA